MQKYIFNLYVNNSLLFKRVPRDVPMEVAHPSGFGKCPTGFLTVFRRSPSYWGLVSTTGLLTVFRRSPSYWGLMSTTGLLTMVLRRSPSYWGMV